MPWRDIIPFKSQSRSGHILRPQLAAAPGVAAAGLPRCFPYESHVFLGQAEESTCGLT